MGQLRVVEHQPVAHFLVKQSGIGKEQVFVVVHETFLNAAVEAFAVRIHFGRFGIGLPVRQLIGRHTFCELALELAAVICQSFSLGVVRKRLRDSRMQLGCMRTTG